VDLLSWGTLAFSAITTVLIWLYVLFVAGGSAP
jgi:hypothetical protein